MPTCDRCHAITSKCTACKGRGCSSCYQGQVCSASCAGSNGGKWWSKSHR